MTRHGPALVLALASLLLTAAVYAPTLRGGFIFDDEPNILNAPGVHWTEISVQKIRAMFNRDSTAIPRRWVANTTVALNHLAGGLEPRGYHVVNLLIHLAVGAALFLVIMLYLREHVRRHVDREEIGLAAAAGALLFLVHPLNTQAVSYAIQRMTSLAALFFLLAFACYLVARRGDGRPHPGWLAVGAVCWLLAMGSKENAVLLPLVVMTNELCFHRATWLRRLQRLAGGGPRRWGPAVMGVLAVTALGYFAVRAWIGGTPFQFGETFFRRDFNGLERLLTQGRVQFLYLSLLALPLPGRLNVHHDVTVSRGLLDPWVTLPAVGFWVVAAALAIWLGVRRPVFGFPVLAYLELHLLESGPVNLELVFEHRMYLPLTMLALLPALGVMATATRRHAAAGVALGLSLVFAGLTYARNLTWSDPLVILGDAAHKSPNDFRSVYNYGTRLGKAGRVEEAMIQLQRARTLDSTNVDVYNQIGNTYLFGGQRGAALTEYLRALEIDPRYAPGLYNVALWFEQEGRVEEAAAYYERFLRAASSDFDLIRPLVEEKLRRLRAPAMIP